MKRQCKQCGVIVNEEIGEMSEHWNKNHTDCDAFDPAYFDQIPEGIAPSTPDEYTPEETSRQDQVDGLIFDLITALQPDVDTSKTPEWDIEPIAEIREIVQGIYEKLGYTEMQFYPYREISE